MTEIEKVIHMSAMLSSKGHFADFIQALYAASTLNVLALIVTKLSIILFVKSLAPLKLHRNFAYAIAITIALWGCVSELVVLFQCHLPDPWSVIHGKCIITVRLTHPSDEFLANTFTGRMPSGHHSILSASLLI